MPGGGGGGEEEEDAPLIFAPLWYGGQGVRQWRGKLWRYLRCCSRGNHSGWPSHGGIPDTMGLRPPLLECELRTAFEIGPELSRGMLPLPEYEGFDLSLG